MSQWSSLCREKPKYEMMMGWVVLAPRTKGLLCLKAENLTSLASCSATRLGLVPDKF